jgi:hypothetical protein
MRLLKVQSRMLLKCVVWLEMEAKLNWAPHGQVP